MKLKWYDWLVITLGIAAIVVYVALITGCQSIITSVEPDDGLIRGIMTTDYLCMPDLEKTRGHDMDILKAHGYNAVYAVADLPLPSGARRPYIARARGADAPTELLLRNISIIHRHGLKVIVAGLNEPSIRHGHSRYMAGVGFRRIGPDGLYTREQMGREKRFWAAVFSHERPDYVVPVLEASRKKSVAFTRELALWLHDQYNVKVLLSCVGAGIWKGDPDKGIYYMPSIHSLGRWMHTDADVKCNDGWSIDAGAAKSLLPQMTSSPGPQGWILWFNDYRGGSRGPGTLQKWHYAYIKR